VVESEAIALIASIFGAVNAQFLLLNGSRQMKFLELFSCVY